MPALPEVQDRCPIAQAGYSPQVGIDGAGNATALWFDADFSSHPNRWDLQTRQISATGALGPTQTLSTAPIGNTAIAVNAEGDTFAVWTQFCWLPGRSDPTYLRHRGMVLLGALAILLFAAGWRRWRRK